MDLSGEIAPLATNFTSYLEVEKSVCLQLKWAVLESFAPENGSIQDAIAKWKFLKTNENPESWIKQLAGFCGSLLSCFTGNPREDPKVGLENIWEYFKDAYPTFVVDEFEESYVKAIRNWTMFLKENKISDEIKKRSKAELKQRLYPTVQISVERNLKINKEILVVKRPVLLVGLVLKEIESRLMSNPKIEEIHFVASEIVYIDCHLRQHKWHGKNVVLVTKHVAVVVPGRVWDLSGNPGENLHSACSGSEHGNIDGEDGIEGKAGEGGGSFTLIADTFSKMDWLKVKLNGGAGGKGQNGGDGRIGKPGKIGGEMRVETLLTNFPSPAIKNDEGEGEDALKATLIKLKSLICRYESKWSNGINLETGTILNKNGGCHVKGTMKDGCLVEFGYDGTRKHAYCLVTGGLGTPGELGGFGGYGGVGAKGGYEGKLSIYGLATSEEKVALCNLDCEACPGVDGERGRDGLDRKNGRCGRNGIDVGYVDKDTWGNKVTYTGTLKLVNDPRDKMNAVWCQKLEGWRGIEVTTRKEPQQVVDGRVKRERPPDGKIEEAKEKEPINNVQVWNEYVKEVTKEIRLSFL